jgi:hypothetical protein
MAADAHQERLVQACAVYQREVALAQIDAPPGEERLARVAGAVRRGAEVCSVDELQALQDRMDEAPASARAALRRLQAWGLETHLRQAILPQQQAIQARQRSAVCVVDEESMPLLASFTAMAMEKRRDRRAAIEAAVGEQLASVNALFEVQFKELCRVAASLGYASLAALWADILPVEPAAQQDEVDQILEETQEVYTDLLAWAVKKRLDVPPGQLRRHDILALFTFPEYQQYYQPDALISRLQACLHDMGVDPHADGRIVLRQCSPAFGPPMAVAVQIPDEIVLMYNQVSGVKGAEAYAGAYGKALLWAYTSPELSVVSRLLGDAALPTSSAQLLAEMVALPGWLHHYLRVHVDERYWPWRLLDRLYRLRRQLGRFLYAQYISTSESLAGAQEAYREIMMNACQVNYHPAYYLTDWDWAYTSLTYLRGWKLAYLLLETLRQQFADDWFRNPDSGVWLQEYWHSALGESVEALLQGLGGVAWDTTLFVEALINETMG